MTAAPGPAGFLPTAAGAMLPGGGSLQLAPPTGGLAARDLALAVGLLGLATAAGTVLRDVLPESDLLMFYLLAVVVAAFRLPRAAAVGTALGAVAAFNFFFTEPRYTFWVNERRYLLTFTGVGGLGLLVSELASRARERAAVATRREAEATALFRLGRALADAPDADAVARVAAAELGAVLRGPVRLHLGPGAPSAGPGVVALAGDAGALVTGESEPDRQPLLEALADAVGAALARLSAAGRARAAVRRADREATRSSLLASVSHDLRTPLATITGAATTLLAAPDRLDADARDRLLGRIVAESDRLERQVSNLLHLTRLEGDLAPALDWQVAQELAGAAAARVRGVAGGRSVAVRGPEAPALVCCDALLVEQALVNLLENALRHAPGDDPVAVEVGADGDRVVFSVSDRGPGVAPERRERVFERFVAGGPTGRTGLGLAIVRAVAERHGGAARVEERPGGGARFVLALPAGGPHGEDPPALEVG